MSTLVSGLFKIVCATCPAHVAVHESVRYQDGILIHYECHGKQHLGVMYPYFERTITIKNGARYRYVFNSINPDVSCLTEPIDCIYVLDTELESLSPEKVTKMHEQLADGIQRAEKPSFLSDEEWAQRLAEGHNALALLARFKTEGK